jgi:hypothetical protein
MHGQLQSQYTTKHSALFALAVWAMWFAGLSGAYWFKFSIDTAQRKETTTTPGYEPSKRRVTLLQQVK